MEYHEHANLVPAVERATHAIALWIEEMLKDLGVTQAEAHVLGYLADRKRCSINDLHHDFGHRRSTLTNILDRLEGRGLVRRMPHPTSRRSVMVELTRDGEAAAERVATLLRELEEAVSHRTAAGDVESFHRVIKAIEEATHDR